MDELIIRDEVAALVKQLPMKLRYKADPRVLTLAVEQCYIAIDEQGRLRWLLESKTLLAYFCGRMWCGDTPRNARGRQVWVQGGCSFPAKDLDALFAATNLRTLREKRKKSLLPTGAELVDTLFAAALAATPPQPGSNPAATRQQPHLAAIGG